MKHSCSNLHCVYLGWMSHSSQLLCSHFTRPFHTTSIMTPSTRTPIHSSSILSPNTLQSLWQARAVPQSQPNITLPPLLASPLELKLKTPFNFSETSDPENAPALMILRRSHTSLRCTIPNLWKTTRPTQKHLLPAERQHPYLFPCECRFRFDDHLERLTHHCSEAYYLFFPSYDCLRFVKEGYKIFNTFSDFRVAQTR